MNYNDATQAKCKHYPSTFQCEIVIDIFNCITSKKVRIFEATMIINIISNIKLMLKC